MAVVKISGEHTWFNEVLMAEQRNYPRCLKSSEIYVPVEELLQHTVLRFSSMCTSVACIGSPIALTTLVIHVVVYDLVSISSTPLVP